MKMLVRKCLNKYIQEFYHKAANVFQPHAFFYQSHPNIVSKHAPVENTPALFVYKENIHYNFSGKYLIY